MKPQNTLSWLPGHIARTLRELDEVAAAIDFVIEVVDARAPVTTTVPLFPESLKQKPRVRVGAHADLARSRSSSSDLVMFAKGDRAGVKKIVTQIEQITAERSARMTKKGAVNPIMRGIVIGLPNVGKSTIINALAHRNAAPAQNRPGTTRGLQWVKVTDKIMILDAPGIIKHTSSDERLVARLAALRIVPLSVSSTEALVKVMAESSNLARDFITAQNDPTALLTQYCERNGLLEKDRHPALARGLERLLNEYGEGKYGLIQLDTDSANKQ